MNKDIESSQPELSLGLFGHVDSGKTSLTYALTNKWTDTHSEELKRGITIRLGYADAVFYKCEKCKLYTTQKTCSKCKKSCTPLRKVSFVDAPGHETLMATMLSGAAIIDGALLLISANEDCPQPQTKEHLMALEMRGIKNIVIIQNKIDLVSKEQALKNYKQIKEFVKGTIAESAPIIPISAQHKINISHLIEAIENTINTPKRDLTKDPIMFIARSFDINRPGTEIDSLTGGVLGGSLKQGILKVKDKIEIKPGIKINEKYTPVLAEIQDLKTGGLSVKEVLPGGSIGVLTSLDPSIVKSDQLTGNILGLSGKMPDVCYEFNLKPALLKRVVGLKEELEVAPIKLREPLMLNVNSAATVGFVTELKKDTFHIKLKIPVCCFKEDGVTISRNLGGRWRLIGVAKIV